MKILHTARESAAALRGSFNLSDCGECSFWRASFVFVTARLLSFYLCLYDFLLFNCSFFCLFFCYAISSSTSCHLHASLETLPKRSSRPSLQRFSPGPRCLCTAPRHPLYHDDPPSTYIETTTAEPRSTGPAQHWCSFQMAVPSNSC